MKVTSRRSVSYFPIVPHAFFALFLGTCGVATLWRGLTLTFPSLAERPWFLWATRLVLLPLVFLLLALIAFVLARWAGLLDV